MEKRYLDRKDFRSRVIDSYYLLDYTRGNANKLLKTNVKLKLMQDDEKVLKEYANIVYGGKGILNAYVTMLKAQKRRGKNMIEILTKEYSIE